MKFFMAFALLLIGTTACDVNRRAVDSDVDMNRVDTPSNDIQREEDDSYDESRRDGTAMPYEGTGTAPRNRKSSGQSGASSSDTDNNGTPTTR